MKIAKTAILCITAMCLMLSMVGAAGAAAMSKKIATSDVSDLTPDLVLANTSKVPMLTFTLTSIKTGGDGFSAAKVNYSGSNKSDVSKIYLYKESGNVSGFDSLDVLCASANKTSPASGKIFNLGDPVAACNLSKDVAQQFYILADVKSNAAKGNVVDALITKNHLTFQSGTWPNTAINPAGYSMISEDTDSDGYYNNAYGGNDCDDANPAANPGATEACNNVDDNCDGAVDEDLIQPDSNVSGLCSENTEVCNSGSWLDSGSNYVPSDEVCDNQDNNCNGAVDEELVRADDNLFGLCSGNTEVCSTGEWADSDANYLPLNETCNGFDDNCNDETDEGVKSIFYYDADEDSFGNAFETVSECAASEGYLEDNTDCNDNNAEVNPDAEEICNGIDDNCNGMDDEGTCEYVSYYCDNDGDSFFSKAPSGGCDTFNCVPGECSEEKGSDCDDEDSDVNPDMGEGCNGIDDNCNGQADEAQVEDPLGLQSFVEFSPLTQSCYTGDEWTNGVGLCTAGIQACSGGSWGDCVDEVTPVEEACDLLDNDCDGAADEAENTEIQGIQAFVEFNPIAQSCYTGPEGTSGVGLCASGLQTCSEGNWSSCANEVLPAEEICDGLDNNCDGTADEGNFSDADADGIKDCADTDGDNDGIVDEEDLVDGNSSDINTNVPGGLLFYVNDVQDEASPAGIGRVRLANSTGNALVEFDYDFSSALDLGSINLTLGNESGFGSLIIRGINLSGQNATKTAYVEKIAGTDTLCIIDNEVDSIVVEGDCSNGIKVSCPGSNGNYSCELADNGTRYKVSGLRHSAVAEYSYAAPAEAPLVGGNSGVLIVVPHNVPAAEEAPAEEVSEEPAAEEIIGEELAIEEEPAVVEEPVAEEPTRVEKARARLGAITGRVTSSIRRSPGAWGGAAGLVLALVLILAIYIPTKKVIKF